MLFVDPTRKNYFDINDHSNDVQYYLHSSTHCGDGRDIRLKDVNKFHVPTKAKGCLK